MSCFINNGQKRSAVPSLLWPCQGAYHITQGEGTNEAPICVWRGGGGGEVMAGTRSPTIYKRRGYYVGSGAPRSVILSLCMTFPRPRPVLGSVSFSVSISVSKCVSLVQLFVLGGNPCPRHMDLEHRSMLLTMPSGFPGFRTTSRNTSYISFLINCTD